MNLPDRSSAPNRGLTLIEVVVGVAERLIGRRIVRVPKILWILIVAGSGLLCVLLTGSWVTSYWYSQYFSYSDGVAPEFGSADYALLGGVDGQVVFHGRQTPSRKQMRAALAALQRPPSGWQVTWRPSRSNHDYLSSLSGSIGWTQQGQGWRLMGIECHRRSFGGITYSYLSIPYWLLVTATGIPIIGAVSTRLFRPRRFDPNGCTSCGYDLRGTIIAGGSLCPECGASLPGATPGVETVPCPCRVRRPQTVTWHAMPKSSPTSCV